MSQSVPIRYCIDDDIVMTEVLELKNKLTVLKNVISLSKAVNFNDYNFYYENRLLTPQDDMKYLKEIIQIDKSPMFKLYKRGSIL